MPPISKDCSNTFLERSFIFAAPCEWNKLSECIRTQCTTHNYTLLLNVQFNLLRLNGITISPHVRAGSMYRAETMNWHALWLSCGCPSEGYVFNMRKATRSTYHKQIRYIERNEHMICKDRFSN